MRVPSVQPRPEIDPGTSSTREATTQDITCNGIMFRFILALPIRKCWDNVCARVTSFHTPTELRFAHLHEAKSLFLRPRLRLLT